MLISIHNNPRFMVTKSIELKTLQGELSIEESEGITIRKTSDERVFIGDPPGNVLEITTKSSLKDLLNVCLPAEFKEFTDEYGESYIDAVPLLEKVSYNDLIARIPITYTIPESTIEVVKIII